jgi:integrase
MTRRVKGEEIIKRRADGRYRTCVTVIDSLGRKRLKCFYGRTPREALAKRTLHLADVARGAPADPSRQLLSDYLLQWLKTDAKKHVRESSLPTYEIQVRKYITPLLGHLPLSAVTTGLVQNMVDELEARGKLAHASIAKARTVLQSALADAVRRGLINSNPAMLARVSNQKRRKIDYWQQDEARRFLTALKGHPLEAFYVLSLMLGWRVSEGLGLSWDDIDLERGAITITRALERSSRTTDPRFTDTKNETSQRTVRLAKSAIAAINAHRTRQEWAARIARDSWHDTGFVFTTSTGRPLSQSNIRRQFIVLCGKAKVRTIRVHDMRHTAATLMIRSRINIKVVSETLGHSSIRITLDLYGHLLDEQKDELADAMERMLGTS